MTGVAEFQPAFRISLVGVWEAVDPYNLFPGDEQVEARQALAASGFVAPPTPGARLLLAATMTANAGDDENPLPVLASVVIHEHTGTVETELTKDGAVIPLRKVRRRTFEWPGGEVGEVSFHEVSYTVPYPECPTYVTVVFVSPNLPQADELEWLYDSIIGTAEWVDPTF